MLRCVHCGGVAQAGLAHLHGDPSRPLCNPCTQKVMAEREIQEKARKFFLEQVRTVLQKQAA